MKAGKYITGWTLVAAVLAAIIIAGGIYIALKYPREKAVEISLPPDRPMAGMVYIGGEVNNPGNYPLYIGDSVDDLVQAAGGFTGDADLGHLELLVGAEAPLEAPQKVNINTADAWLLSALPGIGEVRAQAIVDYRRQKGPFSDIRELLKVEGLGDTTFENIRELITVGD
jgi:competence protein ComEA